MAVENSTNDYSDSRAVSPVVGAILMLAITLVVASIVVIGPTQLTFGDERERAMKPDEVQAWNVWVYESKSRAVQSTTVIVSYESAANFSAYEVVVRGAVVNGSETTVRGSWDSLRDGSLTGDRRSTAINASDINATTWDVSGATLIVRKGSEVVVKTGL